VLVHIPVLKSAGRSAADSVLWYMSPRRGVCRSWSVHGE